jgi:hypothetical protein
MVTSNRVFLYGHFLDRKEKSGPPMPPTPTVAIEILREFSPSELIGKIYVQTRDMNWQPLSPSGANSYSWFTAYRSMQQDEQSRNSLYFQTPERDYWEVIYFRQESDESGAYMAAALRHGERYVVMTAECPHCKTKQKVHVAARTGFAQMGEQLIACIKCKKYFDVMFPDSIIGGPFPV